ncbi:MAG TPA: hypothetical protein VN748_05415 [Pseudonocardiaceae bacterium]|nr:hypothetical protein [Pseudonocardiaceae bacterium]
MRPVPETEVMGGEELSADDVWRWPLGLGALFAAVTALFRYAPRRRQPGLSWLAVGAGQLRRHLRAPYRGDGAAVVG